MRIPKNFPNELLDAFARHDTAGCDSAHDGWLCCRPTDHVGDHVATGGPNPMTDFYDQWS